VAAHRATAANESLHIAWDYLKAIRESLDANGGAETASGLQIAFAAWHCIEAKRRRLIGDAAGEIDAWEQTVASARRAATGWNRVARDASIMRALSLLSEAQQRDGRFDDAVTTKVEAEAIRNRWQLPNVALLALGDDPPTNAVRARVWRWLRALN
jgi:hypothetical protein